MTEERKNRKGDNKSIRFDEKKYELVCSEENLETPQQVVDFLVDKYWWEKRIGFKPEELPTNGRQEAPTEEKKEKKETKTKGEAPDPSNKGAMLKWLRENK